AHRSLTRRRHPAARNRRGTAVGRAEAGHKDAIIGAHLEVSSSDVEYSAVRSCGRRFCAAAIVTAERAGRPTKLQSRAGDTGLRSTAAASLTRPGPSLVAAAGSAGSVAPRWRATRDVRSLAHDERREAAAAPMCLAGI